MEAACPIYTNYTLQETTFSTLFLRNLKEKMGGTGE
jgi:hypothetical protein